MSTLSEHSTPAIADSIPLCVPEIRGNEWKYIKECLDTNYGMTSRELLRRLAAQKIQARPLWQPMHLSPAHCGSFAADCAVAEKLNREAISLPCSVSLTKVQQDTNVLIIVQT